MNGKELLLNNNPIEIDNSEWVKALKGSKSWTFTDDVKIISMEIEEHMTLEVIETIRTKDGLSVKFKVVS